jgi:exonuclease VII large subunit
MDKMEQLVKELREDIDRIYDKQIQQEIQKLSTAMISLEKKTQQDIANVNSKIQSVNERLCQKKGGSKDSQKGNTTELVEHKKDVENSLGAIRSELAINRKEMATEYINSLNAS